MYINIGEEERLKKLPTSFDCPLEGKSPYDHLVYLLSSLIVQLELSTASTLCLYLGGSADLYAILADLEYLNIGEDFSD